VNRLASRFTHIVLSLRAPCPPNVADQLVDQLIHPLHELGRLAVTGTPSVPGG
jgi:hypothetical protein